MIWIFIRFHIFQRHSGLFFIRIIMNFIRALCKILSNMKQHRSFLAYAACTSRKKAPPPQRKRHVKQRGVTPSISRVLSCMTIYLAPPSPTGSSHLSTKRAEQTRYPPHQSVLHRVGFTRQRSLLRSGGLLPHHSTLTAENGGGIFSVALALRSPSADVISYPAL